MSIDTSKIVVAAQEFMASLEADSVYDEAKVVDVGIVVHLLIPDDEDGTEDATPTFCSNDSRVYQTGLFRWAAGVAEWSGEPGGEIPGPDES